MYGNIDERFLPPRAHRPTLTFGSPLLHYAWSETLNAGSELLDGALRAVGADKVAVIEVPRSGTVRRTTYGELAAAVDALASGMRLLGVRPGDRVATRLGESVDMTLVQLATWTIGAVIVPTALIEGPSELSFMLADTEAVALFVDPVQTEFVDAVRAECPLLRWVLSSTAMTPSVDATIGDLSRTGRPGVEPAPTRPLDVSGIYYTGGTTGRQSLISASTILSNLLADS
jgi:acyl-coenzyme A synthetase/AMP-(fatty) acid ligase